MDPIDPKAHDGLGGVEFRRGNLPKAIDHFRRAVALAPDAAVTRTNLGCALLCMGQEAGAIEQLQTAILLSPHSAEAHLNLGAIDLLHGDFTSGWPRYEWRLRTRSFRARFPGRFWRGEPLEGDPIVLQEEQGLGDTIQFCRYAPLVAARGGRVILRVGTPLRRLLSSLPGIEAIADQVVPTDRPVPDARWVCPLQSLPSIFKTDLDSIPSSVPYLHVDPARQAVFRQEMRSSDLNVGLVWAGSPRNPLDRLRSIELRQLGPLLDVEGVRLFSLQRGAPAAQRSAPSFARRVRALERETADWVDTAAAIMALDLVIAVDTAPAHLAGALGKPVWILLSHVPDWRWMLETPRSPWYPTARLFRQPTPGDWDAVITLVAAELRSTVAARSRQG